MIQTYLQNIFLLRIATIVIIIYKICSLAYIFLLYKFIFNFYTYENIIYETLKHIIYEHNFITFDPLQYIVNIKWKRIILLGFQYAVVSRRTWYITYIIFYFFKLLLWCWIMAVASLNFFIYDFPYTLSVMHYDGLK